MNLPPLVERELRVASRQSATFWVRLVSAVVAVAIGAGFFALEIAKAWVPGSGRMNIGPPLFIALSSLALGAALMAGLFLTSDCLSEERREGTLGLLFLTDLRGHDVVLGKLAAQSLRGVFGLLAVFPILAISLMLGGISGTVFAHTVLALLNALLVSLAAGMLVSSLVRASQVALLVTLVLLALLLGGGPLIDAWVSEVLGGRFVPRLSLASPGFVFFAAQEWSLGGFWLALAVNQAVGWLMLVGACLWLPHAWQDPVRNQGRSEGWGRRLRFGAKQTRTAFQRRLSELNPVLWLTCRERWQARGILLLTGLLAVGAGLVLLERGRTGAVETWSYAATALLLLLYLAVASQAVRFHAEALRSGSLELLLVTPLSVAQLIAGQWRGLIRQFALPVLFVLVGQAVATVWIEHQQWTQMTASMPAAPIPTPAPMPAGTNDGILVQGPSTGPGSPVVTLPVNGMITPPHWSLWVATAGLTALQGLANLVAIAAFGLCMGLTSRSANLATLKTLLWVQVVPWLAINFASGLVMAGSFFLLSQTRYQAGLPPNFSLYLPLIFSALGAVLSLGKDWAFWAWSRRCLANEYWTLVWRAHAPARRAGPPPAQPSPNPPVPPPLGPG
jgi:ABC-type transport system involved in multi-copper enzyme maturation permease subunit